MRVAVIDIGTNSTRLLVANVDGAGAVRTLVRESLVTRLGEGVDATGRLSDAAVERTLAVLRSYRRTMDEHGCEANLAVMTSAARDASNGERFEARVRAELDLDARTLSGDEEAQLTFLGAMSGRTPRAAERVPGDRGERERGVLDRGPGEANGGPATHQARGAGAVEGMTLVIDIGGGSTELILGAARRARSHVSLQAGVVRMSERHIRTDPPTAAELEALAGDVRAVIAAGVSADERRSAAAGIAVAGTATSAAAIAQRLEPYDPARVHGYALALETVDAILARVAAMREAERRQVAGLHPDRAPTIVAGMILLGETMRAFGLRSVEVSEHDLLLGGALWLADPSRLGFEPSPTSAAPN
ncbi:MAG: Ppx/GppA family phosphatase [Acidobacteriota bacterium]|nr:Ppx/GppA family phosphatase [Acidobacteriota bacterium]